MSPPHDSSSSSSPRASEPQHLFSSLPEYGIQVSSVNPKHSNVDILLSRRDRTYRPNELVQGALLVAAKDGWSHYDINLCVSGAIELVGSLTDRSSGVSGGASSSGRNRKGASSSLTLVEQTVLIKPRGRICAGIHKLPFTFPLLGIGGDALLETYRGTYITVTYTLGVTVERGFFARTLDTKRELVVQSLPSGDDFNGMDDGCVPIRITPESITENSVVQHEHTGRHKAAVPAISVHGRLDRSRWSLDEPITGDLTVGLCAVPIKSIEVRLVRIERILGQRSGGSDGGQLAGGALSAYESNGASFTSFTTEVQTAQIADGDIPRGVPLPIFMVLPRLLVCSTVIRATIRIEFAIELMILFSDGTMVSETYPITLYRHS